MDQTRDDADSYRRVEVITGAFRRRYWSAAEKARIVAESAQASANISEVARRHGVSRADSDEAGRAFRQEAGHRFRFEAGRGSDLMSAT